MTLAFSENLNNELTLFPFKILFGLEKEKLLNFTEMSHLMAEYMENTQTDYRNIDIKVSEKIHTIREYKKHKWYAGMKIHFVINNRTKNRYQFAPVIPCISVQSIVIDWGYNTKTSTFNLPMVIIGDKDIKGAQLDLLARNDGFENASEFLRYFNTNFKGKIIHWTKFKY